MIIYDRQAELGITPPSSAIIIGCGGLGSWLAIGLAACGVEDLTLIDGDTIEITNLNRTPYQMRAVGENKARELASILKSMRPDGIFKHIPEMCNLDMLDILWKGDVVVDCTDDYEFQKACCKWSEGRRARYVRVGCNINHITVTSHVPDWSVGESGREQCGVHTPAWIVPCMKATQYAIDKIIRRPNLEVSEEV